MWPIIITLLQLVAIFVIPILIIKYRHKPLTKLFGPVGMAYFWGLMVALLFYLLHLAGLPYSLSSDVGEIVSYVAVGIAIPLLLFSCSLAQIKKLTKPVLTSFGLLTLTVMVVAIVAWAVWGRHTDWGTYISAAAIGLYTGGTPNFISIGLSVRADFSLIVLGNLSDMMVGGIFYVFLLTLAKPLLLKLIGVGDEHTLYLKGNDDVDNADEINKIVFSKSLLRNIAIAFGSAVVGAGVGVLIWLLKGSVEGTLTAYLVPGVMIVVTICGIAFSFAPKVHKEKSNSAMGQYLILVFSFALSSSLQLENISAHIWQICLYLAAITFLTFFLHALLCKCFHIGCDCALVTLTAGVYGPAFVPAIAKQLKNQDLVAPGLICGSIGYAIGTFLGVLVYLLIA